MLNIAGFKILETLIDRPNVLVCRAYGEALARNVVLKILRSEFPTPEQIQSYENEFELLKQMQGEGIPRVYDLLVVDKMRVLVLEDIGGSSLSMQIKSSTWSVSEKVSIALSITKALATLQANGVIHRDIKPDNIVLNTATGRLQIADFGLARKGEKISPGPGLTGTLQYISPEQTGRTQNPVDYRSDYYSLGATLYELFSGRLPFTAADEMEWVHCQIAVSETPLHELNSNIPVPLSLIVQKLMRKDPEERYQSSLGILRDLESCLQMKNPDEFRAGASDVSAEFRLPTKLYGREEEIKIVDRALARSVLGGKHLILVDGDPGIGKSSLVHVAKDGTRASGGYFLSGKFDQFRKDIPFSALIQAFNQLVSQILTEDEGRIQAWREKILAAMGENAAIVTDVLPQVELIIGKMPEVRQLESSEQRQRFQSTFHAFIRACSERGRPLVIFLDDLQWADSASRSLLQMFLTEKGAESLLFIGAYRHGEVGPGHPLSTLLSELSEKLLEIDSIHLTGLSVQNIYDLVSDSFPAGTGDRRGLAKLVFEKTNGNPFFVSQFLKALYDKDLLTFDQFAGWTWELEKIHGEDVTSNVIELLSEKIARLPEESQEVLELAACFGAYFKLGDLKSYNQKSDDENSILLQPAVDEGLILRHESGDYKFIHDRVQEAAYGLMSQEVRSEIHWQIANRLLSQWNAEKVREGIFYLVNHLNSGNSRITTQAQREKCAELNLIAAERANNSSVYDLALQYAQVGTSVLQSDDWVKYEHLLKPLTVIKAKCQYARGDYDEAMHSFRTASSNISSNVEKARIYRYMVDLQHMRDRNEEAIDICLEGLELLGEKIPRNPHTIRLFLMILKARRLLLKRLQGPEKSSPPTQHEAEFLALLSTLAAPAFALNKNLLAYTCLRSVLTSLPGGYLDAAPRSLFNVYLWNILGDFKTNAKSVEHLAKYYEEADPHSYDLKGLFALYSFSMHIVKSYKETIKALDRANHLLALQGNILYAFNTSINAAVLTFFTDKSLVKASERYSQYRDFIQSREYGVGSRLSVQLMINTIGAISDPDVTPEKVREAVQVQKTPLPRAWYGLSRLITLALMGEWSRLFAEIADAEAAVGTMPFYPISIVGRAMLTIVRLRHADQVSGFAKLKLLRNIRKEFKFFKKLSAQHPANFKPLYLMLCAEKMSKKGHYFRSIKYFHEAILAARKSEVVFFEPFAWVLLAEVYGKQGLGEVSTFCLRGALYLYDAWGAAGVVASLNSRYPGLAAIALRESKNEGSRSSSTSIVSVQNLDLNTVLKATNTLISEIEMGKLVEKLLTILIENAGAERAILVLMENQALTVRGEVSVKSPQEFQLTNIKLEDYKDVPRSMVTYVSRTLEPMVIEEAIRDDRLVRDEYVTRNRVMSSACLPILSQGTLRGIVYLENNAAKGVFSPERVELMTILSGQIAISLENAALYQTQAETIRMQNELATAHAVQSMLFPPSNFECAGASVSGFYQPATECGGDWWSYSKIGDWVYCYIGDATGHGAPAALVTSAACSAVSVIESQTEITPEEAMSHLNKAISRATKGQINMTFFIGALNTLTGEFRYVRASHEPALLLRKEKLEKGASLRSALEPLMGINGTSLAENPEEEYVSASIQLQPGDTVVFYTDGLPDLVNKEGEALGERGFLEMVYKTCGEKQEVTDVAATLVEKVEAFRNQQELRDDVTICFLRYSGQADSAKKAA